MPLPAFPTLTDATALTKVRSAQYNELIDALTALKFWSAKGDLPVGYDADQLEVLSKPSVTSVLTMTSAGVAAWAPKDGLPGLLHAKNKTDFNAGGQVFNAGWADISFASLGLNLSYTCTVIVRAMVTGYNASAGRGFAVRAVVDGVADGGTIPFNGGEARNEAFPYEFYFASVPAGINRVVKLQCQADTDPCVVERGRLLAFAFVE